MSKTTLLFFVILIEGYVVLACELLAIRQLIPFVGSGTEIISIIISAVLLPLAFGYHVGGSAFSKSFEKTKKHNKKTRSIRKILLSNVILAVSILTIGLSYFCMTMFFLFLHFLKIDNRLIETALYSIIFLSFPVFLLGQTVPIISGYFSRLKLSEITGTMLFFSTSGSFLGSVFSTIVLMSYVGVHNTVFFTIFLLCLLVLLISRKLFGFETVFCIVTLGICYILNSQYVMNEMHIVSDNSYNTVQVFENNKKSEKILMLNRSNSSQVGKDDSSRFAYIAYIEDVFIRPLLKAAKEPKDILIIGAGGFTLGRNDEYNNYTFVDIDKDLQKTAEKYFLPDKLSANKKFVASSARAFVHKIDKKYDLIVIDVYTNIVSIPMETITREFLLEVKKRLKDDGIVVANVISRAGFSDKFSVRYYNTFASVFPVFSRQIIGNNGLFFDDKTKEKPANIMYIYFNNHLTDDTTYYTDDKNSYSLDRLDDK